MKRTHWIAVSIAILAIPALTGCGSSGSAAPIATIPGAAGSVIGAGGCLNTLTAGQTIGFSGTANYSGSDVTTSEISAGGGATGGAFYRTLSDGGSTLSFNLSVAGGTITPTSGYGYGASNATVSGGLVLGPDALSQIQSQLSYYGYGYGTGYPYGTTTNTTCISVAGVALNFTIEPSTSVGNLVGNLILILSSGGQIDIQF